MNYEFGNHKPIRIFVGAGIFIITLGFVFFLIHGSYEKPSYTVSNNNLTISGQFGTKINLSGAAISHEHGQVPATETKTNGAAIGKIEKGNFKISGSEVYLNVMDENASNYILITDKNGSRYYIDCASPNETDQLYSKISNGSK